MCKFTSFRLYVWLFNDCFQLYNEKEGKYQLGNHGATTLQVQSKDFDFQHMEFLHNGRKIQISLATSLLKTSF